MNVEKEKRAIEYLKAFEPQTEPYYLCYSGGKDSDAIRILASLAGVKHDIVNNHTTVDAPETVRYIRSIPNIQISYPSKTMWQLIVEKGMPPTRIVRYCCAELKERGGKGRVKITGVRKEESYSRAANSGLVKIIGKPKTVRRDAENMGVNFQSTVKGGGGIKSRQCGNATIRRALLPNYIDTHKPYYRLDYTRCVGFPTALWMRQQPSLSRKRILSRRLHRMPYVRIKRNETRIC